MGSSLCFQVRSLFLRPSIKKKKKKKKKKGKKKTRYQKNNKTKSYDQKERGVGADTDFNNRHAPIGSVIC